MQNSHKKNGLGLPTLLVLLFCAGIFLVSPLSPACADAYAGTKLQRDLNAAIERVRKGTFTIEVLDVDGKPVSGHSLAIHQTNHEFVFGGALFTPYFDFSSQEAEKRALLELADQWFNTVVDGNGFKWPSTEKIQGIVNFSKHQRITQWARNHRKALRHHTLFWSNPEKNTGWVKGLEPKDLEKAIFDRIKYTQEIVGKDITSIDVINEMLYFSFFRDGLGTTIVPRVYTACRQAFPEARLYVNEFPPQQGSDFSVFDRYVDLIEALKEYQTPFDGVGLQAHWDVQALASAGFTMDSFIRQMSEAIDRIAGAAGMPVLISEYDAACRDEHLRAEFLDAFYSMAFANPNVEGILAWEWVDNGKHRALVNQDLSLTLAGKRYEEMVLKRWKTELRSGLNARGRTRAKVFFGDYKLTLTLDGEKYVHDVFLGIDSPRHLTIQLDGKKGSDDPR